MTHCTIKGFRKNETFGPWASPEKWSPVLERYPNLKVCFGHFGADDSLVRESISEDQWPAMIIELMKQYPNVYADISFHTDPILGTDTIDQDAAYTNYQRNVKSLLNKTPTRDRLLFGTDFWMVRTVTRDLDYWAFYKKMFTPAQFKRLTQTNPTEYLGLPDAANPSVWLIERHLNYFKSKKMKVQRKPAPWLSSALAASGERVDFVVVGSAPSWSRSNWIHYILYEYLYGDKIFRKADLDAELPFEEYGRFKLANLRYWDESPEPAIFEVAVKGMASDINKVFLKRYKKWVSYNKAAGVTEKVARKELIAALKNPDWYIYQLAELCDALYSFSHPDQEGGADG